MSSIDTRVVEAQFKNDQFSKGVGDTIGSLDKLKTALHLPGAAEGLQNVNKAAGEFNATPMEQGAGRIGGAFSAMQAIAFGALASIGAKAVSVATQVVNAFSFGPLMQGFSEYETNMTSIQTILANTQAAGTNLTQVNAALDELNHYADMTIYNFATMAKNIGTFTAAGVDLDKATGAIKGIANLAALSGSNSDQASTAMQQLSQALAAGRVNLQDWNSVVNAGMGGTVFQRALAQTAVAMGTLSKGAVKLTGDMQTVSIAGDSFRNSISADGGGPSWLTSDVLTATLNQFTGDLTEAELAAQGFSKAQIKAIQDQAAMAQKAATEVKTFSGLMDTLKEGVGSQWSAIFRTVIGDFEESKALFTELSDAIGGFFSRSLGGLGLFLEQWKYLNGRTALLDGMRAGFEALGRVLVPIGQAFRMVFPRKTAMDLAVATNSFRDFMISIRPSAETFNNIRRTAQGLFAVLGIGWEVVKALARFIFQLTGRVNDGGGSILAFTANIGDFLVSLHRAIKEGEGLKRFFDRIIAVVDKVIAKFKEIAASIGKVFGGLNVDFAGIGRALGDLITALFTFGDSADSASGGASKIMDKFGNFIQFFGNVGDAAATAARWLGNFIAGLFDDFDYDAIMKGFQTGAITGIAAFLYMLQNALRNFNLFSGNGPGVLNSMREALNGVSGTLKGMQNNLNAQALLKLAGAIGIMAISVMLLSTVDGPGLVRATAALTVMFINLAAGMKMLTAKMSYSQIAKLNLLVPALIGLSVAIGLLTISVKALSTMSWEELGKGMGSLAAMLAILAVSVKAMSGNQKGMIRIAASLLVLSVAIGALVFSVKALAGMSWEDLGRGLAGFAVILTSLALFTRLSNAGTGALAQAVAIAILAAALLQIVGAIERMAALSYEEIGRGATGVAAGIAAIAAAMWLMPGGVQIILASFAMMNVAMALGTLADVFLKMQDIKWEDLGKGLAAMAASFALVVAAMRTFNKVNFLKMAGVAIVAFAVHMLANALMDLSGMKYDEIARGLTALAGTMLIMGIALKFLQGSLVGAIALVVLAGALAILVPVLMALGSMSVAQIATALGVLAGVFVVLGVAGYLLAPIVPVLFGLAGSLALLGAAAFLAGLGVVLFATGLVMLSAAGAAGVAAIVAILSAVIGLIPMLIEQIAIAIVAFVTAIGNAWPAFYEAATKVILALLQAVIDIIPKAVETFKTLIQAALDVIVWFYPAFAKAALELLTGMLQSIADNIGKVVEAGANVIIAFLDGLADQVPRVVEAAFQMIIDINNGIADAIEDKRGELVASGLRIVNAILDGIVDGIKALGHKAIDGVKGLAGDMVDAAKDKLWINSPSRVFRDEIGKAIPEGIAVGIQKYGSLATDETVALGQGMLSTMGKSISGLGRMINDTMSDDLNPVVTPVLDLSDVQRDSALLGEMLKSSPINVQDAAGSARQAAAGIAANRVAAAEAAGSSQINQNFTQVNNSPKPISSVDLYRQTESQLSVAKGALTRAYARTS